MTVIEYQSVSKRVRGNQETQVRERQCIGPHKNQRSKDRGLCINAGANSKGWIPETYAFFGDKPRYKGPTSKLFIGPRLRVSTFQARCLPCDRSRLAQRHHAATILGLRNFSSLSNVDLSTLNDEDLVVAAQVTPTIREDAFEILMQRTTSMREDAARRCSVSAGYSEEDTLASSMEGVYWAVWSYKTTKKTKFRTHAYNWIKRYSENRNFASQPLRDQYSHNTKNEDGSKKQVARFVCAPSISTGEGDGDDAGYQGPTFDGVAGGTMDKDQGMMADLMSGLDTLEDDARELVTRKFLKGESFIEIAADLGVNMKTVSNRVSASLLKLRSVMKGYDS
jgi:RNA polymerase sigma factor (sigma-70 family)